MQPTKIEWVVNPDGSRGFSWNPIVGCSRGCWYCYARRMYERFHGKGSFAVPRLVPEQLAAPAKRAKPSTILVGTMTDIFGPGIRETWLGGVHDAMCAAPQHTYLLLSKFPDGYAKIRASAEKMGWWFGTTVERGMCYDRIIALTCAGLPNTYISFEPLLDRVSPMALSALRAGDVRWAIIGACTGPGGFIPLRLWVDEIIGACEVGSVPVFVKDNLLKAYPDLARYRSIPYLERM